MSLGLPSLASQRGPLILIKVYINGSVKRIIETRWSARGDAVGAVKKQYIEILQVLEKLTEDSENQDTRSNAALMFMSRK